jgi:nitrite reductase [NAD(P)H] small subunit
MTPAGCAAQVMDIGSLDDIPLGEGRTCVVGGLEIAVFRTREGEVHAVQARCPHRGGPLADGLVGGGSVVCPLHARRFDLRTGEPIGDRCRALATYQVEVTADRRLLLRQPARSDAA